MISFNRQRKHKTLQMSPDYKYGGLCYIRLTQPAQQAQQAQQAPPPPPPPPPPKSDAQILKDGKEQFASLFEEIFEKYDPIFDFNGNDSFYKRFEELLGEANIFFDLKSIWI